MKDGKLTPKQRMFVSEYLVDLNATQAAIRAGYSSRNADKIGSELLGKTRVSSAIQEQMNARAERTLVTADRVIKEYARVAFFDPKKIFDESGRPLPVCEMDEDTRRAVAGLDVVVIGNTDTGVGEVQKIKITNKLGALEALGKHLGIFEKDNDQKTPKFEKVEVTLIAANIKG